MSTEEELEKRRRVIREEFLSNLASIGISEDVGAQIATATEDAVKASVDELVKILNERNES